MKGKRNWKCTHKPGPCVYLNDAMTSALKILNCAMCTSHGITVMSVGHFVFLDVLVLPWAIFKLKHFANVSTSSYIHFYEITQTTFAKTIL